MIRLENITKSYKDNCIALNSCSLEIEKGEFVFVVGPSGSGKTTFLRLLLKEETPDSGRMWVAGRELGKLSHWRVPYLRRNIGCVFQDFRLLPNKTVAENVAFAMQVIGRPKHVIQRHVPQVLELVGLADKLNNFPDELSGGEQQRVAVARAFINRPLIILADEPTGNLDPTTSLEIMKLLDRINRTGTTMVIATHDSSMVDVMRRRVIELNAGNLVRDQSRGVYGYSPEPYVQNNAELRTNGTDTAGDTITATEDTVGEGGVFSALANDRNDVGTDVGANKNTLYEEADLELDEYLMRRSTLFSGSSPTRRTSRTANKIPPGR
jgi:cell division transport system ATP-binding protein